MAIGGFTIIYAYLSYTWSKNYGGLLNYEVPKSRTVLGYLLLIPFGIEAATYTLPLLALAGLSAAAHLSEEYWNPFHSGFLAGSLTAITVGLLVSFSGGDPTQWFQSTDTAAATTILGGVAMAATTLATTPYGNPVRHLFLEYDLWGGRGRVAEPEPANNHQESTNRSNTEARSDSLNDIEPEDLRANPENHPFKGEMGSNDTQEQSDVSDATPGDTHTEQEMTPPQQSTADQERTDSGSEGHEQTSNQKGEEHEATLDEYQFPWEEPPETRFQNIGGYDTVKESLRNQIIEPLRGDTESYDRFDVEPSRGILFHGPPGTGKTLFARALANELNLPFVELNQADLTHEYVNKSPQIISRLFDEAQELGGVVFIDEAEQLLGDRSGGMNSHQEDKKITNTFLSGLTQDDQDFIVLLTTNRRDNMDDAILRPGRVDEEFEIGMPNEEARTNILKVKLADIPHKLTLDHVKTVAEKTDGWSGADLNNLVNQAKIEAAGRGAEYMTLDDIKVGYEETKSATE